MANPLGEKMDELLPEEEFTDDELVEEETPVTTAPEATGEDNHDTESQEGNEEVINAEDLLISESEESEHLYYENYMEMDFFKDSVPEIMSMGIISGFGLATILALIGYGIFKAISIAFNINTTKGE